MASLQATQSPTNKNSNINIFQDEDHGVQHDDMIPEFQIEEQTETQKATQTRPVRGAKKRKPVELKSPHWKGFDLVWVEEGDPPVKKRKDQCKLCTTLIAADSPLGTNGLKNHTTSCMKKHAARTSQSKLAYAPNIDGTGIGSLTTWKFDQKAIRLALCEMIILDELPFIFVERDGFKRFVQSLCPQFQIPSRVTIREDCVKLFLEQKDRMKLFFEKQGMGRVSITTDCWTSVNNTNFICVTAHCIGRDWILHKKIISFSKIVSHKGADIGESIVSSLRDWGLKNVLCCTVDNASANEGAVKYVQSYLDTWKTDVLGGKYLHMRCAAHILNLVVQDGLEDIGMSVRRVREAVKWIKASPMRSAQFQECVKLLRDRIDCNKSLCLDVPTRWNSTYLMLESARPYEEAFKIFENMYSDYGRDLRQKKYNDLPIGPPDAVDWFNVGKMSEYLKKFYELTLTVSGTTYATSHLLFVEMCDIISLISSLESDDDVVVRSMAENMRLKIGKYWLEEKKLNPNMNRILYIAALFDPRLKMKYVEKCFKKVYGFERAACLVKEVTDSLKEIFDFYKKQKENSTPTTTRSVHSVVHSHGRVDRQGSFSLENLQSSDEESDEDDYSEITIYLTEKPHKVTKDFDILQWWSTNCPRFPILSDMARDILAIPISSVASESAFSTGGRVLCAYRSSLTPNMVEALICTEDWLRSSYVEKKYEEGVSEEELEKEFKKVLGTLGGQKAAISDT